MNTEKILKMINNGEIEELKQILKNEIYKKNLCGSDAKKRYAAMKRFFKYNKDEMNPSLKYPYKNLLLTNYNGEKYNSFCDMHCFAFTKEDVGSIEDFSLHSDGTNYFDINAMINLSGGCEKVNIDAVLANAKSQGYKFIKNELDNYKFTYLWNYKDAYYKIGILDQAYSIIQDDEMANVYYQHNKSILFIETGVGLCGILPVNPDNNRQMNGKIIIK